MFISAGSGQLGSQRHPQAIDQDGRSADWQDPQWRMFDMGEYGHEDSLKRLLGEDREDPGLLPRAIDERPHGGILLLDEIDNLITMQRGDWELFRMLRAAANSGS